MLCLAGYVLWYVRQKLTEKPEHGNGESNAMYMSKRSGSSFGGGLQASDLHLSTGGGSDNGLAVPVTTTRSWGGTSAHNRCTPLRPTRLPCPAPLCLFLPTPRPGQFCLVILRCAWNMHGR